MVCTYIRSQLRCWTGTSPFGSKVKSFTHFSSDYLLPKNPQTSWKLLDFYLAFGAPSSPVVVDSYSSSNSYLTPSLLPRLRSSVSKALVAGRG